MLGMLCNTLKRSSSQPRKGREGSGPQSLSVPSAHPPLSWKIEKGPLPGPSQANLLPAAFPESANQPTPLLFSSYASCPQASFGTYLDLLYFLYSVRDSATPLTVNLFEVKREGLSHQVQLSPAAGSCGRPLDEVCWSDFAKSTRRVLHKRFSCKGTLLNKFLGFFTE